MDDKCRLWNNPYYQSNKFDDAKRCFCKQNCQISEGNILFF